MVYESEGILCLAEQLLPSQEALCSIELAVRSGFENCNGENLETNYNIIGFWIGFHICCYDRGHADMELYVDFTERINSPKNSSRLV